MKKLTILLFTLISIPSFAQKANAMFRCIFEQEKCGSYKGENICIKQVTITSYRAEKMAKLAIKYSSSFTSNELPENISLEVSQDVSARFAATSSENSDDAISVILESNATDFADKSYNGTLSMDNFKLGLECQRNAVIR